ncbi:MAG: hypothetical protein HFI63_02840 [Lachnospiraceae bacterium]|nr:hypothetical protein [Lachnospiraceae bacterium]
MEVQFQTDELPDILYASDTLELSLQACNTGRAQIRNVRASLYAEGLFPDGEVFIGNLEAGTAGEGTMQVYIGTRNMESAGKRTNEGNGEIYGPVEGRIIFQYEDVDGRVYEEVKSFQTEIKKAQVVSFAVEEPEETNSWWVSVTAVAFTGLLLWILLLFLRLRKKNILLAEAISSRIPEGGERKR